MKKAFAALALIVVLIFTQGCSGSNDTANSDVLQGTEQINYSKSESNKDFTEGKEAMRKILESEEFTYKGGDLGAVYSKDSTVFKVWAPTAENMKVVIYKSYDAAYGQEYSMSKAEQGVWDLKLPGDLKSQYYTYKVTIDGAERETVDPYAKGAAANGKKGMIVDFASINPEGWESHKAPEALKPTEAVVYEMHVRDFSVDESSGIKNKGRYLAFTEKGTKGPNGVSTGLEHLKELGITHLHLLPVYDFASVDETKEGQYNWGYDPYLYNVPEGSYSTNPYDGTVRIKEFKEMVQTLHENDIRVVMDVVFNHTYTTGDSPFDILVPGYYYRTDKSGSYTNGSGCGNETASEKAMVRKFIVDSVKFWATEYRIDGFRFDLMALHDIDTMKEVERELRKINPNILIYGEPWTGGASALSPALQLRKGSQKGMNIAVFNDDIRNAIKGDNDGIGLGFVNGAYGLENEVKKGIVGGIQYSSSIHGFTEQPAETINYVSSHDNLTLFDKLEKSNPSLSAEERVKMNRLALSIVLTSEGIPFIQGGTKILRTKNGSHNSYNAGDMINKIDWSRKSTYMETYSYIKGLIELRRSQRVLTLDNAEDIKKSITFVDAPKKSVAYMLSSSFKDDFKNIVIIHNANRESITVKLPKAGQWKVIANELEVNQKGVTQGEAAFSNEVEAAPLSTYILVKE
ncbi:MAG: type pullulanase [Clostridia bacterium]|jgi:pullulanase|nr:type pullulanase [Clostridia bacterium]